MRRSSRLSAVSILLVLPVVCLGLASGCGDSNETVAKGEPQAPSPEQQRAYADPTRAAKQGSSQAPSADQQRAYANPTRAAKK